MKKRLLIGILMLCVLFSAMVPAAYATETAEETTEETVGETKKEYSTATSGTCGKDLTWKLEDHTLIISGSGKMDDGCPWEFYKDTIDTVIFDGEITSVGAKSFASCNNLESVDFGDALVEIGEQAFYSCNALEKIHLPATFRKFGAECFRDCESLEAVYCEGPMPSFKGSCLYNDHTVVVYYTVQTPWPEAEIQRLMSNFGGRIYVQLGTAEDWADISAGDQDEEEKPAAETEVPRQETEAPPETEAVQTEPPVTEAMVPETVAETVAATIEETEPATEAEAEPTETTLELVFVEPDRDLDTGETKPVEKTIVEEAGSNGWIWMVVVAAGLTLLLVLALIIRGVSHKGGKYSE